MSNKILKIVYEDGRELHLKDAECKHEHVKRNIETEHGIDYELVETKITIVVSGFDYIIPSDGFFKKWLRGLL